MDEPHPLQEILEWTASMAGCQEVPADSQVYLEATQPLRRVLFGVDIDVSELLIARDAGYDAVIAHHPLGDHARTDFARVVYRQVDQMTAAGIGREAAVAAVEQRLDAPHRALHMSNVNRVVDVGRLVGVPFCNIHLACDILGRTAIVDLLTHRDAPGATVANAIQWLDSFAEIAHGPTRPEAWAGSPDNRLGRWVVAMAGGTNGGYPVFSEYWNAGVDTIFAMHCAEQDLLKLREIALPHQTLVVTGHMATDSIGINLAIAQMERRGIAVTRTAGIVAP